VVELDAEQRAFTRLINNKSVAGAGTLGEKTIADGHTFGLWRDCGGNASPQVGRITNRTQSE
jgi:hypothetical protein